MKKELMIAAALLFACMVKGQNLVPNPGFEIYQTCDFTFAAIDTNSTAQPVVPGWLNATAGGTPDYFHRCQVMPSDFLGDNFSVPNNAAGHQEPHHGDAYAGINLHARHSAEIYNREYLQSKLADRLEPGRRYCAGFRTSYANQDSIVALSAATLVAPRGWGMSFSAARQFNATDPFQQPLAPDAFHLPGPTHISSASAITDTAGWTLVSGVYTAVGGEEWITIGNFNPVGQPDLDTFYNAGAYTVSAYYYIDDVFAIPMDGGGLLPRDTALCASDFPLRLDAFEGFTGYLWGHGDTTGSVAITGPGTYTVMASYEGCPILDTITISALPPPVLSLDPVRFCADELPATYALPDTQGFERFTWADGTMGTEVVVTGAGGVAVTALGACGIDTATLVVEVDYPLAIDLGSDLNICEQGQEQGAVLGNGTPLPVYEWSTGETSQEIYADSPGLYTLRSQNACGIQEGQVTLYGCAPRVYIPDAFRPGSVNAANRLFRPFAVGADIIGIDVFDRWGGKVYTGSGSAAAWDGTRKGTLCSQGVYSYIVRYKDRDGKEHILHGGVMLLK